MNIDKAELDRRIASTKNVVNRLNGKPTTVHKPIEKPNVRGPNVPTEVKVVAGALAVQTSVREASEALDVSMGVVREAKNSSNPEVKQGVSDALERVRDLALDKLMNSLDLMTNEKLNEGSAKDLAVVAANMSRVVEKTSPRAEAANVQLVVYAPQQRQEKQYKVVDV